MKVEFRLYNSDNEKLCTGQMEEEALPIFLKGAGHGTRIEYTKNNKTIILEELNADN